MTIDEEFRVIRWPSEFVVEYVDGSRERLLRGDGVLVMPPTDDPEGRGGLVVYLPKKHARNQKRTARHVRFTEIRAVYSPGGDILWSSD